VIDIYKSFYIVAVLAAGIGAASAQDSKVLNLYSSRHYQTDEALYSNFTKQTGIRINRIEAGEDPLIERIRNEGERSPADVLITVDAGRLWRAEQLGFFQPVKSALLDARIPASLREPGGLWYGFSLRARLIAYNKAKVKPADAPTYESLAEPKWKGRICMRSSTNMYNLSLLGAIISHLGEQKAEQWAKAVKGNLARDPRGGDTDQLKSVAAGECDVTLTNQYYYARLLRSEKADEPA
jgi:iron(III) transport system substrate-binding protein